MKTAVRIVTITRHDKEVYTKFNVYQRVSIISFGLSHSTSYIKDRRNVSVLIYRTRLFKLGVILIFKPSRLTLSWHDNTIGLISETQTNKIPSCSILWPLGNHIWYTIMKTWVTMPHQMTDSAKCFLWLCSGNFHNYKILFCIITPSTYKWTIFILYHNVLHAESNVRVINIPVMSFLRPFLLHL